VKIYDFNLESSALKFLSEISSTLFSTPMVNFLLHIGHIPFNFFDSSELQENPQVACPSQ
jgi:hypothetical protein